MSCLADNKNMNTFGCESGCVFLRERRDGQVNLADFNFPDGEYKVSIWNADGYVISTDNRIIKENRKVQLYRYYEGSDIPIVAQSYKIPMDDINQKVLQFIMENCPDITKIFIDSIPSLNNRLIEETEMVCELNTRTWIPVEGYDSIDLNKQVVKFKDIIEFSEKYMIIKGFMQVGKTNFIISAAVWFMLNGMSSVIILRNCNSDKDQLVRRVKEYNARIQAFLGDNHSNKFVIEAVSNGEITKKHFTGKHPVIVVGIANTKPLKKINNIIENNKKASKKFALFLDEVDFIDSNGTGVQKELDKLREHCFCSYGVSATILDSAFKRDIEKGNVIILSTPENYKSVVHFKPVHLPNNKESCLVTTIGDDIMTKDNNVIDYLDKFETKKPHYVELYDDEKYGGGEEDIRPECHHPVISLLHLAITNSPNIQLLSQIQTGYGYPAMYFMGGGTGSGCVYLSLLSEKNPITLSNGKKSKIIKNEKYADMMVKGEFHIFYGASPALVLEWLKNNGGVKLFPRIIILAGVLAGRCQSFGSADFNSCLSNKTLGWHLTEMYLSASKTMDSTAVN